MYVPLCQRALRKTSSVFGCVAGEIYDRSDRRRAEMTQIEDILRAMPHVVIAIEERKIWGVEYRDPSLESKRRSAILWLRSDKSKRGWVRDRVINCKREEK